MTASPWWQQTCRQPDAAAEAAALARQAQLTKPRGALGALEALAVRLAALQGREKPAIDQPHLTLFAGDHGVVAEGVSAYPQAVTAQMLGNFVAGGAAISVLAREQGVPLRLVDLDEPAMDGESDEALPAFLSEDRDGEEPTEAEDDELAAIAAE